MHSLRLSDGDLASNCRWNVQCAIIIRKSGKQFVQMEVEIACLCSKIFNRNCDSFRWLRHWNISQIANVSIEVVGINYAMTRFRMLLSKLWFNSNQFKLSELEIKLCYAMEVKFHGIVSDVFQWAKFSTNKMQNFFSWIFNKCNKRSIELYYSCCFI